MIGRSSSSRSGFTLVELLVVIAIIGVLIALLLPAVQAAREAARRAECSNNLKQLALGMHNHHDTLRKFPPGQPQGFYYDNWYSNPSVRNYDRSCWVAQVLPFCEQNNLHDEFARLYKAPSAGHTVQEPYAHLVPDFLTCPSDGESPKTTGSGSNQGAHTNYLACHGSDYATTSADPQGLKRNGLFYGRSKTTMGSMTDGTSNTVMFSEILQTPDPGSGHDIRGRIWNSVHTGTEFSTIYPPNSPIGDNVQGYCSNSKSRPCGTQSRLNTFTLARSNHPSGVQAGLADGSVRFVSNSVSQATWRAYGTVAGGETANLD